MNFTQKYKYEILLLGLLQHLFVGIFLTDLDFYARVIWPLNMIILGIASLGLFSQKSKGEIYFKNILLFLAIILPLMVTRYSDMQYMLQIISLVYTIFFGYIFYEVMRFLIHPEEFNTDVLSAAGCGYLLLIEIFTFFVQFLFYGDTSCLQNVTTNNPPETFIDLVYFVTITFSTIGYGDIVPTAHYTKLLVALMGLLGQFYTVVLTGILVSNFAPNLLRKSSQIKKK